MNLGGWFRHPRVVLTLFICLMATCGLALSWLGWQVLVQERSMEAQQRQERLESAADRAVAAVERALDHHEVEIAVRSDGTVEVAPAGRLAYLPVPAAAVAIPADAFDETEAMEFGQKEFARVADAYQRLAEGANLEVRAGALVRLGRVLRKQGRWAEALKTYAELERMGTISVAGMPAGLVARAAHCSVLEESGSPAGARRAAFALWEELKAGKWVISKGTLETYLEELKTWAPDVALPAGWEEKAALAEAAAWAFAEPSPSGRAGRLINGHTVSLSWQRSDGGWKGRLAGPGYWRELWAKLERDTSVALRVAGPRGAVVHGNAAGGGLAALRPAAVTGLPWSVTATFGAFPDPNEAWSARRRLLVAGLLVFAMLLAVGTLLIARAISRELAVSRLQSDFVSAVSHEFRTPLTSIRQLTELLARGRMPREEEKQRAYELMLSESDRLRRLVESLLDFGRMQAREYKFRCESVDVVPWARSIVAGFQQAVGALGNVVEFTAASDGPRIFGDREALGGALWNLLDNAVKYSPGEKRVKVAVASSNGSVEVSVRDSGAGIAREELKRVFRKFYRGANAKKQGTKGTGIGLAMVKEIVEAHGGTVRVQSELGRGSEFIMVLPCNGS